MSTMSVDKLRERLAELQVQSDLEIVSFVIKLRTPAGSRIALSLNATGKDSSYAPWGKRTPKSSHDGGET